MAGEVRAEHCREVALRVRDAERRLRAELAAAGLTERDLLVDGRRLHRLIAAQAQLAEALAVETELTPAPHDFPLWRDGEWPPAGRTPHGS
jgi:hypothetical protein